MDHVLNQAQNLDSEKAYLPLGSNLWVAKAVFLYLCLPHFIFYFGWLKIWAALPLALLLVWLGSQLLLAKGEAVRQSWLPSFLAALFALGVGAIAGVGGFGYQNSDHIASDGLLKDLVLQDWPVVYTHSDADWLAAPRQLIYYLGFYLPAAVVGKVGEKMALTGQWLWFCAGLFLLFRMLFALPAQKSWALCLFVAVSYLFFGGADVLGWLLMGQGWPQPAAHIEWWAGAFQYSSHLTQLFWVPQHSLATWLVSAVMLSMAPLGFGLGNSSPELMRPSTAFLLFSALVGLLPLWSPFGAVGVLPLYLWCVFQLKSWRHFRSCLPAFSCVLVCSLPSVIFLLSSDFRFPGAFFPLSWGANGGLAGTHSFWHLYFLFCSLEFLALAVALLFVMPGSRSLLVLITAQLLLIPLFKLGTYNDFAMRSSISPLFSLWYFAAGALPALLSASLSGWRAFVGFTSVAALLVAGFGAPFLELQRSVTAESRPEQEEADPVWEGRPALHELRPRLFLDQRLGGVPAWTCQWLYDCGGLNTQE